ncbi:glycosyltransferase [bacterium]|nr:glycosyltransferase [bacterium]
MPTLDRPATAGQYYEFARPELLERVPLSARRVLDIGCGAGVLGGSIRQRQQAEVVGIEFSEKAARAAASRLDRVIHSDVDQALAELPDESFDCIICGDVLEHLVDPLATVRQIRSKLTPEGTLVASIPNVRHHSVLQSLLAGNWTYESAGLLDRTHLRFFTRREIDKLFFRAGFIVDALDAVYTPEHGDWKRSGASPTIRLGHAEYSFSSSQDTEELFVYQHLVTASRRIDRPLCLTSIIIVVHNQVDYTQQAINSIRLSTDEPYELIIVDNGSSDGTASYLASLDDIKVVSLPQNLGYPGGVNRGLMVAEGSQILLLNNDVIVTTGWLHRMLEALASDPKIGMVGPCSNNVSGPQQIAVDYQQLNDIDGFAWDHARKNAGRRQATNRLVGFCLLMPKRIVDEVGPLDERFGLGLFDDDDYCKRVKKAGYDLVIARDAFVHHFGSRTFLGEGIDTESLLRKNHAEFMDKWSVKALPDSPSRPGSLPLAPAAIEKQTAFRLERHAKGGLVLRKKGCTLSLCMIVRDNERTIEAALTSIRPWVDEMIVVDTGSKDATPDICRRLGAQVFEFPWCDDFSAARNESLRYATGDWIFWMDSDDTIDERSGQGLRELVARSARPETLGYTMQVHCPGADDGSECNLTKVDHVKVFKNGLGLRFEGRIHEQILPAIRRLNGEVEFTDFFVVHSGSDLSAESHRRKIERDLRILKKDLEDRPNHPFVLFNFGMTYADAGRYDEAIGALRHCLIVSQDGESHVRKAYALLAGAQSQKEEFLDAWETIQEGRKKFPDDPELLFREAILHQHFGRLRQAEECYHRLMRDSAPRRFDSVDDGLRTYKSWHNLARVHEEMGNSSKALLAWKTLTDQFPIYRLGWRGYLTCLLSTGALDEFDRVSEQFERKGTPSILRVEAWLAKARRFRNEQREEDADQALQQAEHLAPHDPDVLREVGHRAFQEGDWKRCQNTLNMLLLIDPSDASAWYNLALAQIQLDEVANAILSLKKSNRLRSTHDDTRLLLERLQREEQSPSSRHGKFGQHSEAAGLRSPITAERVSTTDDLAPIEETSEPVAVALRKEDLNRRITGEETLSPCSRELIRCGPK